MRNIISSKTTTHVIVKGWSTIELLLTVFASISIANLFDLFGTMLAEKVNPTICKGVGRESTPSNRAIKHLNIWIRVYHICVTNLNVKIKRLLLSKFLSTGFTFVRKISRVLLQMVMHGILLVLRNDFCAIRAYKVSILVPSILNGH